MKRAADRSTTILGLRILVIVAGIVLAGRIIQIQVFAHEHYGRIAQVVWGETMTLAPVRGRLHDRNGQALAVSVTTWEIGIPTSLLTDIDRTAAVAAKALNLDAQELVGRMRRARGRYLPLANHVILTREQKAALESDDAINLDENVTRIYPHDGVGASLLGFFRYGAKDTVATGLEYSLSHYLAGKPGSARKIKTPAANGGLGQIVLEEPVDGEDLTLTLDVQLQAICESQLQQAVARCKAKGGSVLILDPQNGDVLAAASWPLMASRQGPHADPALWNNCNFTSQYEPGSVFKVFTMASLLSNSAIDTATVFDCNDPDFNGYRIDNENHHRYGNLSLMRAFTKSSNIYFARAVGNLSDQEFYRDLVSYGFGQLTSIPYQGQVKGILRRPAQWSKRSKSTLGIGQEIAVTPLQLGLALCAVANGGTLYAPRLIRDITNPVTRRTEEVAPLALRQVMSPELTAVLREAMGRVVEEGTGVAAKMDWIATGGKTGTAQLSIDGRSLQAGAFMASFGGIAPLGEPRLVILTVLNQPQGIYHFASQSAVPLFREILREIRNETAWLTDVPGARTAMVPSQTKGSLSTVPDVLFLSVDNAAQRLGAEGFAVVGAERPGLVIQQVPGAGTLCKRGQAIQLTVGPLESVQPAATALCPDFSGLSDRQVRSLAGRLGISVVLVGNGYVRHQNITSGEQLNGRVVQVEMGGL